MSVLVEANMKHGPKIWHLVLIPVANTEERSFAASVILLFKMSILKWSRILLKQHLKILNLLPPEIFISISQIPWMQLILFCQTSAKGCIHPSLFLHHCFIQIQISRQLDGDGGDLAASSSWLLLRGNRTCSFLCVPFPLCHGAHTLSEMGRKGTKPPARCWRAGSSAVGQLYPMGVDQNSALGGIRGNC